MVTPSTRIETLLCVTALSAAVALYRAITRRDSRLPPGPKQLPLFGNLFNAPKDEQWLVYREWSRAFG